MLSISSDGTIKMSRGEGIEFRLSIERNDGTTYLIKNTDEVHFFLIDKPILNPASKKLLDRKFNQVEVPDGKSFGTAEEITLNLTASETMYFKGSEFYYVIVLMHKDTTDTTITSQTGYEYYGKYPETVCHGRLLLTL